MIKKSDFVLVVMMVKEYQNLIAKKTEDTHGPSYVETLYNLVLAI